MKEWLLKILVDPVARQPLKLEAVEETTSGELIAGTLRAMGGKSYSIRRGIPRLVLTDDPGQLKTSDSFEYKWKRRETYDSQTAKKNAEKWYLEKYGFKSLRAWVEFFDSGGRVLDVGCGSGFSSSLFLDTPYWKGTAAWIGVDISEAIDVARERLEKVPNAHFVQGDALSLPFPDDTFSIVFSEGVFHHTPSTRQALKSAARVLAPNGEFSFYVYRRKSAVREFTDDYVRRLISPLSDEEAWAEMRSLTHLAQALAEAKTTISVPVDVLSLGIKAGEHDVQRLIYWHFAKLFWNSTLTFEENVHVNFDWYRPVYAHRHTAEEVRAWCEQANLRVIRFHEQESGFTVRAIKLNSVSSTV